MLSTGKHSLQETHAYFVKNEKATWKKFQGEMNNRHPGDWLYVKPGDPEQPPDLGYLMGSRICEAYYEQAEDKTQAVLDILSVVDYQAFLRKSSYGEKISDFR